MGPAEITPSIPVSASRFGGDGDCARATEENKVRDTIDVVTRCILSMANNDTQYLFISKSLVWFRAKRCLNLRAQAILGLWSKFNLLPIEKHDRRSIYPKRRTAILVGRDAFCHLLTVHVFLKSLEIEPELGGAGNEERADIIRPDPIGTP